MSNRDPTKAIDMSAVPVPLKVHHIRYTPEPWVVRGDGDTLCVTDSQAAYIVDRFSLGGRSHEEHVANARLIAAAPRLLSTVVDAVNLITEKIPASDNDAQVVVRALIAAINLAVEGDPGLADGRDCNEEEGGEVVYCHACSLAGGADRPIHHGPPACSLPSEKTVEAVSSTSTAEPTPVRQYFCAQRHCPARGRNTDDPECICWFDEGTGPDSDARYGDGLRLPWRDKPDTTPVT